MLFRRFSALVLVAGLVLASCGGAPSNAASTVYDLTLRPQVFASQDVTVLGVYLWKPGDPSTAVLLPGVSTAPVGVSDAQPIYASVACQPNGPCAPSNTVGVPTTGAVWLDNFPAAVTADLHRPTDSVWGDVEVTGRFERGNFGPAGAYQLRINVSKARAMPKIERVVSALDKAQPLSAGAVSLFDLADRPGDFVGKAVTTQGYYFWSPATSGLLVEQVTREKNADNTAGIDPHPAGRIIALDGFPPDVSQHINVGEGNAYVWGLIELTGTFETSGKWGPNGEYDKHFVIDNGKVKVLGK